MHENILDIEALVLRCRTEQAKTYISEAILSYSGGAYRSSIVSTWIAVVFDLVDKINELALTGNAKALSEKQKYENYIKQIEAGNQQGERDASNYERNILQICKENLELLDSQQYKDLIRLREDRCRCAHPSYQISQGSAYKPSAEQARLHIRNAIIYVLSQPPVQGKAALEKLIHIVSSDYFPIDNEKAEEQLKQTEFKNANKSLIKSFVDNMMYGFVDKDSPMFNKRSVLAAINGAKNIYPNDVGERFSGQINKIITNISDDYFVHALKLCIQVNEGWDLLSAASKEKIKTFIQNGKVEKIVEILESLWKINENSTLVMSRIDGFSLMELDSAIKENYFPHMATESVIRHLSRVNRWEDANKIFKTLIFPIYNNFSKDEIRRILNLERDTGAHINDAFEFATFIRKVKYSNLLTNSELIDDIGEDRFNELFPPLES